MSYGQGREATAKTYKSERSIITSTSGSHGVGVEGLLRHLPHREVLSLEEAS